MELASFRTVESPTWLGFQQRTKGFYERGLLEQETSFGVFNRNSSFSLVLMLSNFSGKLVQPVGGIIDAARTEQTHFCAWGPAVNHLGLQAIDYQERTVVLIVFRFQEPAPIVGHVLNVEPFRC